MTKFAMPVLVSLILLSACSAETRSSRDMDSTKALSKNANGAVSSENIKLEQRVAIYKKPHTKEELEVWLRVQYGEIKTGYAILTSTYEGSKGPFVYELPDGSIIQIDGYANKDHGYFVDPRFKLSSLPKSRF
jgi:hypothetical protein